MLDRLLSGAGAVSHLADRIVGVFVRGSNGAVGSVGILLAVVLGIGAAVGLWSAVENSGDRSMHEFAAGDFATADPGDRTFASVSGAVAWGYIESYLDTNDDGKQSADETGQAWDYFLVDPETRVGLTVHSDRPPEVVFRSVEKGVVVDDPQYVAEDITQFQDTIDEFGLTLEPSRYIDSTKAGAYTAHSLADGVPVAGTAVEIDATRADFLQVCSGDANGNGTCDEAEVDYWDVLLYDPASHQAVTVLTDKSPEFTPVGFSGLLRRSAEKVAAAQKTDDKEFSIEEMGITLSPLYLLDDGARPTDPLVPLGLAIVAGLIALVIVIGTVGGKVRFRPDQPGLRGSPAAALAAGERLPLHVTGILRSADGYSRAREASADLVRFVLAPEPPPAPAAAVASEPATEAGAQAAPDAGSEPLMQPTIGAPSAPTTGVPAEPAPWPSPPAPRPPETTLIVERSGKAQGVAVGRGELTGLELGTAMLLRRPRPALRLRAGTGTLVVSFDDVAARDRAARELMVETGILGGS